MIRRNCVLASSLCAFLLLAACDRSASRAPGNSLSGGEIPIRGGDAVVLLGSDFAGSWPSGLDPATNVTGGSNLSLMNAIYGGLFQIRSDADGGNPHVSGVLASGYELSSDGLSFQIHIREGVRFSDGTPLDAEAVKFNVDRSLSSSCSCAPRNWPWAETPVSILGSHSVVLHFSRPFAPAPNAFPATNLNWIASPSALKLQGEDQFRITPVGAGPFRVVSNQLSTKLVLERNPLYWEEGRPYLDRLTFQSIGSEQAAYQALSAHDADAFEGMQSPVLIEQALADESLLTTPQLATSPLMVQLNTAVPPFDNPELRQAIYYATDVEAIRLGLFKNWYPTSQSFTAPGGLFYQASVPGYRTFDLEKAKAIVDKHGRFRVTLGSLRSSVTEQVMTALQSQWRAAGIDVSIETYDLGNLIGQFQSKKWQAMLQTAGSYDPDAGSSLSFRFKSGNMFSGVSDRTLDSLMASASATTDITERQRIYREISVRLSDEAYAPFLVAQAPAQLSRDLRGPGLTTKIPALLINTAVLWQDVWKLRK